MSQQKNKNILKNKPETAFCDINSFVRLPCCTIMESISDGVFTTDVKKRILSFNKAAERITGFKADEAIGRYCFDIFRSDICENNCALKYTLTSQKSLIDQTVKILSKSGQTREIKLSTAVLKNEAEEVIGAVETFRDVTELENLKRRANLRFLTEDIIGKHPKIEKILSYLPDIAKSDSPIIIEGPTGSGKELIARAVHNLSDRKNEKFIAVNCGALPESLLESELFGYTKGAFTGAFKNKPGRFQAAHKGTLFLDEISNTSLNFQAALLRILEDGQVTPLGINHPTEVDVRIITATNSSLENLVNQRNFRQDLYYRLNVVKITLPSLFERKTDIPLLTEHFISKLNLSKNRNIDGISKEVLDLFMDYPFHGNVRELENIIEFAFIICKDSIIKPEHLPEDLFFKNKNQKSDLKVSELKEVQKIRGLMKVHGNNKTRISEAMGISRSTLWRKLKKYNLS
jgi:PAS domain S-box-containing protein